MLKLMIATIAVVVLLVSPASARRSYEASVWDQAVGRYSLPASDWRPQHKKRMAKHERSHKRSKKAEQVVEYKIAKKTRGAVQIVKHPAGCPRVAFCGCGSALYVFKKNIRELWLARNWLRFPVAKAAAGMVAVRVHHVMVILEPHGDGTATVYDPNSGRHLTRIHRRSLSGFSVRDPHGSTRYAFNR